MILNRILAALGLIFLVGAFAVAVAHDLDEMRCRSFGQPCMTYLDWLR